MSDTRAERRRVERTKIKNSMKFEMKFELLQPWSTFVMKTELPPHILKKMIKITDEIIEKKDTAVRAGDDLAGEIKDEFWIPRDILDREELSQFFLAMCNNFIVQQYCQNWPGNSESIQKEDWQARLQDMWVVSQKDNEYNPSHIHYADISAVMYLKIPEYLSSRKSLNLEKHPIKITNDPYDGAIEFSNNTSQDKIFPEGTIHIQPQVGDFFIFPAGQRHQVYPFRTVDGKGERRSASFNAVFSSRSTEKWLKNKMKIQKEDSWNEKL